MPHKIVTLDSGRRQQFQTGAQRDEQTDKPRFDLIPLDALDLLQELESGVAMEVDRTQPPITGWCDASEVRVALIPALALNRLGGLYHRGAVKYGENNYQKGIPLARIYASLFRHVIAWKAGDTSEDHLAAIAWNAIALMFTENAIAEGALPAALADAGPLTNEGSPDEPRTV